MVVSNRPSDNVNDIQLIRAWRPTGSLTTLWAQDMTYGRLLHLVQWGGEIYLPVREGMRLGIGVYNGSGDWKAYPTYIEAKCLYDNGPAQPNDCTSDDMWELSPFTSLVMDALKNGDHQTGGPLIIVPNGLGMGVGEATFGTDEYRGQIRVYERSAERAQQRRSRRPFLGSGGGNRGGSRSASMGYEDEATHSMRSFGGPADFGFPEVGADHRVGIGAGAEEQRESVVTGVHYKHDARLVAALRVESRKYLVDVLRAARLAHSDWHWTASDPTWFVNWRPSASPVPPHIPIAPQPPHRPEGENWGRTY